MGALDIDIATYRRERVASLGAHPLVARGSRRRVPSRLAELTSPLHHARKRFFEAFELEPGAIVRGAFWGSGPELVSTFDGDPRGIRLERREVRSTDGEPLDAIRTVLLLEYQELVLDMTSSPAGRGARDVVELATGALEEAAIARSVARLASFDGQRPAANETSEAARGFHQRLLLALWRQLVSTYENHPAELGVTFVPAARAEPLGFNPYADPWAALLERSKLARVLSDGRDTHFVFSSIGEYLGLHDRRGLSARGCDPDGLFGWRLRASDALVFQRGSEVLFELRDGGWTFRSDARLKSRLERAEPSFGAGNRLLWDIARRLSESRSSAILLVVDEPSRLAASGACRPDLAVVPAEPRITSHARRAGTRGLDAAPPTSLESAAPLEEHLLDQLQGRVCEDVGEAILLKLATVDGALLVDRRGVLLGFGVIFATGVPEAGQEGAGTNAARFASAFGTAIQVSSDGPITAYRGGMRV
jgi:hypothetical protein